MRENAYSSFDIDIIKPRYMLQGATKVHYHGLLGFKADWVDLHELKEPELKKEDIRKEYKYRYYRAAVIGENIIDVGEKR